jgi:hypothetical protein
MASLFALARERFHPLPDAAAVSLLYQHTFDSSPGRRFLVDLISDRSDIDWMSENQNKLPGAFHADLNERSLTKRVLFPCNGIDKCDPAKYMECVVDDDTTESAEDEDNHHEGSSDEGTGTNTEIGDSITVSGVEDTFETDEKEKTEENLTEGPVQIEGMSPGGR